MYYTYILYSEKCDRFYIGQTDNLNSRLQRHNTCQVKSTKAHVPWQLKYYEEYETRSEAMKREKFLKGQRNRNFYKRLIESTNGRVPSARD